MRRGRLIGFVFSPSLSLLLSFFLLYYILIIILAPIVLVVSLIVLGFSAVFLGLTEFSSMDYLPSGVKKFNDIIDIIPRPKNENEIKRGPDGDISESKSFIKRSQSAADNVSTFSESITDNSKNIISDSRSVVSSAISPDTITDVGKESARAMIEAKKKISDV